MHKSQAAGRRGDQILYGDASVWNLRHVTLSVPRILRWLLHFYTPGLNRRKADEFSRLALLKQNHFTKCSVETYMNKTFDLDGVEEDVGMFKLCSCPELRIMKDSYFIFRCW